MITNLYVIFDTCAAVAERPFVMRTDGEALRMFSDLSIRDGSQIAEHPEHYTLFRLGTYDDNKMQINPEPPAALATAVEMVAQSQKVIGGKHEVGNGTLVQSGSESEDTQVEL